MKFTNDRKKHWRYKAPYIVEILSYKEHYNNNAAIVAEIHKGELYKRHKEALSAFDAGSELFRTFTNSLKKDEDKKIFNLLALHTTMANEALRRIEAVKSKLLTRELRKLNKLSLGLKNLEPLSL